MNDLLQRGKKIINSQQNTVLSAASLIMVMIGVSMVLGLISQRVLASYFAPDFFHFFLPLLGFRIQYSRFWFLELFLLLLSRFLPEALNEGEAKAWKTCRKSGFDWFGHIPFCCSNSWHLEHLRFIR